VVSSTGAIGVGQIEPSTAVFVSRDILGLHATLDAHLADANIRMSTAYLAWLLWVSKGNVANAIGGYYEGVSTLRDKGVYASARRYVANVGGLWAAFRSG
jgi:soluble lytic murein transglycosylase-like protein